MSRWPWSSPVSRSGLPLSVTEKVTVVAVPGAIEAGKLAGASFVIDAGQVAVLYVSGGGRAKPAGDGRIGRRDRGRAQRRL